ncbi:MAG TPA: hypothetical protein VH105_00780 [Burkholderiales bacterium]|jgi:hypothetical protein|nr:hypothetical protein [Burkholderiales bacterium]
MDARQLLQAAELAGELAENYYALPEGGDNTAQAAVALSVARLYMLRYARHLESGHDAYEALKRSVADGMPLAEREMNLLHLIVPPGDGKD